ncbi:MAG: bifunctional hydroxymethylpyrimidine kinase/phosphomethylpyrimidine kinase [Verrucomicrobia bacterium]|nr:bifunctional hydroxymethylpyrimidine kinase/phosphomethylpyrimidine kinase [Verrucomicrobiota bacterium]
MNATRRLPVALTIAGSDSGAGAGIQADLRTFNAFGLFGTSVITCVTAQNPGGVSHIQAIDVDVIRGQFERVFEAFPPVCVKTGMLFCVDIINTVVDLLATLEDVPIVVDPVMLATSGVHLLERNANAVLCERLLPQASVLTPNIPEAEFLVSGRIADISAQREAARAISERYGVACVVKGGHLEGDLLSDVLCVSNDVYTFSFHRSARTSTHGTGCTFAAALAARLGLGDEMNAAVDAARQYVKRCLDSAQDTGRYEVMGWGQV